MSSPTGGDIRPVFMDRRMASLSSLMEPMQISSLAFNSASAGFSDNSVRQTGRGVPQYRLRLRFQSTMFSSQLPNRPSPVDFGFQLMVLFNSTILSFRAVVFINQA